MSRPGASPIRAATPAQIDLLVASGRAVLSSFRAKFEAGTLPSAQHAPLLLLEDALIPFAGYPGGQPPLGGSADERPPGSAIGLAGPAAGSNRSDVA
ncbi:MAG: hypothetical protein QOH47_836 [Sphingomonadales bacterium]|nr:hypothetical protein [Sphingomonadales bacterium]